MKKSLLFNVFFLVFVNFLVKPFWVFGIDRTVQNQLGETEYGLYFAILNFTYLFQIFLDFGLQNYNARHIASNEKQIGELFPNIILFKLILFVVYLVICIAVAVPLNYINHRFFFIILANQFLLSFIIYLRSNISAHQHFITDSLLSVLDKLLMIIFCAIIIWGNQGFDLSIINFVLAQFAAYLITFIVALLLSFNLITKINFQFSTLFLKQIFRESLPYASIYFLMTIYYRIDGVMLERMKTSYEAGIYAQGYRIMESVNNIGYLMSIILLPIFANYLSKKIDIKIILMPALRISLILIVGVLGVFYFQAEEIIGILYHADVAYSSKVFSWLVLNFIPISLLYVIGTLLTADEQFRIMLPTLIFAVVLNIVLNYFMIQNIGAIGAAKATFITQLFMLLVYGFACIVKYSIKLNLKTSLRVIFFIGFAYGIMHFLLVHYPEQNLKNLFFRSAFYIIAVMIIAVSLGIMDKQILKLNIKPFN